MPKKWVRPIKPNYTGEIHTEYRKHLALVEQEVNKYLPSSNDLPTTNKDNHDADKQLDSRKSAPFSTSLAIVGMFATKESSFLASASRDQLIKHYKNEAQNNWVKNHIEVLEDIRLSGRRWKAGNN